MEPCDFMDWKRDVFPALQSKLEEFHHTGYESVTIEEIWDCVMVRAKKKKAEPRLHVLVHLILTLSLNDFMTWLTMKALKEDTGYKSFDYPSL